jgi:acetyl esterase/lipase
VTQPETIVYARREGIDLSIDVFRPSGKPKAAVILLHGGGWRVGSKEAMTELAQALAGHGFVALPAQYRLLGQSAWPAPIQDVKSAIRWARRNAASLGVDAGKIALEGFSAGAHLALLAGGTRDVADYSAREDAAESADIAAVIAFFPPIEFRIGANGAPGISEASRLLEERVTAAEAERASPITHAGSHFPPTCLFHGTDDHVVSHVTSQRMFERLGAAGVAVDLHLFAGHTHEFSRLPSMLPHVQSIAASFLDRHVVEPDFHVQENLALNPFASSRRP